MGLATNVTKQKMKFILTIPRAGGTNDPLGTVSLFPFHLCLSIFMGGIHFAKGFFLQVRDRGCSISQWFFSAEAVEILKSPNSL